MNKQPIGKGKMVINALCIFFNTLSVLYLGILSIQHLTSSGIFQMASDYDLKWIVPIALLIAIAAFIFIIIFSSITVIINYKKPFAWVYGTLSIVIDLVCFFGLLGAKFTFSC